MTYDLGAIKKLSIDGLTESMDNETTSEWNDYHE